MSWPSIPRSRLRERSICARKWPTDSALAWSIASLKRMMSSAPARPARQASIHRRRALARSARYSATSWLMSKPPRALSAACVWAAVSAPPASLGARPLDFSDCSSRVWTVPRSLAIASRIGCAWSRNASAVMSRAAGSNVPANASHSATMPSMSSRMNSAKRMRPSGMVVRHRTVARLRQYARGTAGCARDRGGRRATAHRHGAQSSAARRPDDRTMAPRRSTPCGRLLSRARTATVSQ